MLRAQDITEVENGRMWRLWCLIAVERPSNYAPPQKISWKPEERPCLPPSERWPRVSGTRSQNLQRLPHACQNSCQPRSQATGEGRTRGRSRHLAPARPKAPSAAALPPVPEAPGQAPVSEPPGQVSTPRTYLHPAGVLPSAPGHLPCYSPSSRLGNVTHSPQALALST